MDLTKLSPTELLRTHAQIIDELMHRQIVRTKNNPIGDYTEWLVCNTLRLEIERNSKASYDGTDASGLRYQIKGRRIIERGAPAQFSVIRNLEDAGFDFLIAVVFDADYRVRYALQIAHQHVDQIATFRAHQNGHIPILRETDIRNADFKDVTNMLQSHHRESETSHQSENA